MILDECISTSSIVQNFKLCLGALEGACLFPIVQPTIPLSCCHVQLTWCQIGGIFTNRFQECRGGHSSGLMSGQSLKPTPLNIVKLGVRDLHKIMVESNNYVLNVRLDG